MKVAQSGQTNKRDVGYLRKVYFDKTNTQIHFDNYVRDYFVNKLQSGYYYNNGSLQSNAHYSGLLAGLIEMFAL